MTKPLFAAIQPEVSDAILSESPGNSGELLLFPESEESRERVMVALVVKDANGISVAGRIPLCDADGNIPHENFAWRQVLKMVERAKQAVLNADPEL